MICKTFSPVYKLKSRILCLKSSSFLGPTEEMMIKMNLMMMIMIDDEVDDDDGSDGYDHDLKNLIVMKMTIMIYDGYDDQATDNEDDDLLRLIT